MKCFVFLAVLAAVKAAVLQAPPATINPFEGDSTDCQCKPKSECPQINEAASEWSNQISLCGEDMVCCPTSETTPMFDTEEYNEMCRAVNSKSPFADPMCCGRQVFKDSKVSSEDRIYGGQETQPKQYPWMVRIFTNNRRKSNCAGFLIGSRHVLTADHCVYNGAKNKEVGLGCDDGCEKVIKFSYTDRPKANNSTRPDIAILRLAEEVPFSNKIRPICLPAVQQALSAKEEALDTSKEFVVAGWGKTKFGNAKHKMHAFIQQMPHDECEQLMRTKCSDNTANRKICEEVHEEYHYNIQGHLICAGSKKGNTCIGDSGGPLMKHYVEEKSLRYEAAGITTTSLKKGRPPCDEEEASVPHIFVDIKEHMDWINITVTEDFKKI